MESKPSTLPFNINMRLLSNGDIEGLETRMEGFGALLPATTRTYEDHIRIPFAADVDFLERELLVPRINNIHNLLWLCGRPMPPRALHYQKVLSREITITENVELHLVWSKSRIFIKPIPRWLIDPDFWSTYLIPQETELDARQKLLAESALGFLFTYTALISYESDFVIAQEKGLIPKTILWEAWRAFAAEILQNHSYNSVNLRYWYGELRLSRLNKIYRFRLGHIFRGYSKVSSHFSYNDLLHDNFAVLAIAITYIAVVLTAMQVGLATQRLVTNQAFQDVSYGFTIFTIIAPLIACASIVLVVIGMMTSNLIATRVYQRRRSRELGVKLIQP
jgi:hypothetical protein